MRSVLTSRISMRLVSLALILTACNICFFGCASPDPAPPDATRPAFVDTFEAQIPKWMDAHNVPGLSIAVVTPDSVVWQAGFGVTDASGGDSVTTETVFEAASLSKPVLAVVAMTLADRGRLDLDASLVSRVDSLPTSDPRAAQVTARMVLRHTTGFPNWAFDGPLTMAFDPGTDWQYSGSAHVLLQHAIEQVEGDSLDAIADTHVFGPLGMTRSRFTWQPAYDSVGATGHTLDGEPAEKWRPRTANGAASLHTTAAEYARFVQALLDPAAAPIVLSTASRDAMWMPAVPVDTTLGLAWGHGWAVETHAGRWTPFHWGANRFFRAFTLVWPDEQRGLVVFTNGAGGLALMDEIVRAVDGHTHPLFDFRMLHPD